MPPPPSPPSDCVHPHRSISSILARESRLAPDPLPTPPPSLPCAQPPPAPSQQCPRHARTDTSPSDDACPLCGEIVGPLARRPSAGGPCPPMPSRLWCPPPTRRSRCARCWCDTVTVSRTCRQILLYRPVQLPPVLRSTCAAIRLRLSLCARLSPTPFTAQATPALDVDQPRSPVPPTTPPPALPIPFTVYAPPPWTPIHAAPTAPDNHGTPPIAPPTSILQRRSRSPISDARATIPRFAPYPRSTDPPPSPRFPQCGLCHLQGRCIQRRCYPISKVSGSSSVACSISSSISCRPCWSCWGWPSTTPLGGGRF
jgi:hypothetical protein